MYTGPVCLHCGMECVFTCRIACKFLVTVHIYIVYMCAGFVHTHEERTERACGAVSLKNLVPFQFHVCIQVCNVYACLYKFAKKFACFFILF